jgi:hypothetical protein
MRSPCIITAWLLATHGALAAEPAPAETPPARKGPVIAVGIGAGLFRARSGNTLDERRFSGETLSLEALFGGHLTRHFTLGAALARDQVFGLRASDSKLDGDEPDLTNLSFFTTAFSLFGDFELLRQPRLHFLGFLGYGGLFVDGRRGSGALDIETPSGFTYAIAVGCEYRVAEHVALGGRLRLSAGTWSVNERSGTDVHLLLPALLAGARWD